MRIRTQWTDERVELLKKLWPGTMTVTEIAEHIGNVSPQAVVKQASRLCLGRKGNRTWTDERIGLLKKLWPQMRNRVEIAKRIGVSYKAVTIKAVRLGLTNKTKRSKKFRESGTAPRNSTSA